MASRTVLHVGTMKTGTTHLQNRLDVNRSALLAQGVLVPGGSRRSQVQAVRDLIALCRGRDSPFPGAWSRLVEEVRAHDGTAVISMEFLATVSPRLVEQVCADLPGVEAVVTARDLNRNLPAMWQTTVRSGRTWTWEEYLAGAEAHQPGCEDHDAADAIGPRHFWTRQHLVSIVRRWAAAAPTTVLTLPHPGASRELLWDRFCEVVGAPAPDGGWLATERDNQSLGLASCLMVLALNRELDRLGSDWVAGLPIRKDLLTSEVLPRRRHLEPALGLPVPEWVERRSELMLQRLRGLDVRLVGDWEELRPVEVPGVPVAEVGTDQVTEAALAALAAVVEHEILGADGVSEAGRDDDGDDEDD